MWKSLLKWVGKWLLAEAVEEIQEKVSDRKPAGVRDKAKQTRKSVGKTINR